ncbi:MAG: hypothetical protein ABH986_00085 [archaeon]
MNFVEMFLQKLKKETRFLFNGMNRYELQRTHPSECAAVLLSEVKHPDHYFYLNNNLPIKSLCELSEHLKEMDESTFKNHVNPERNDFSQWVSNTIGDKTLGKKMGELSEKDEMSKAVEIRVNYIKRRAEQKY